MKKINLKAQIFKSKDIILKPINIECLEDFYKHSLNRKVFKFINYNRFTKKKTKQYLQNLIKKSKHKNFQTWQIIFKSNFAGTITLRYSDAPNDEQAIVSIINNELVEEIASQSAAEESYIQFRM